MSKWTREWPNALRINFFIIRLTGRWRRGRRFGIQPIADFRERLADGDGGGGVITVLSVVQRTFKRRRRRIQITQFGCERRELK